MWRPAMQRSCGFAGFTCLGRDGEATIAGLLLARKERTDAAAN